MVCYGWVGVCSTCVLFAVTHLECGVVPLRRILVREGHLAVFHVRQLSSAQLHRTWSHDGGDEESRQRHSCRHDVKGELHRNPSKPDEGEFEKWCHLRRHRFARVLRVVEDPSLLLRLLERAQLSPQDDGQVDDEAHHRRCSCWHRDRGDVDVGLREQLGDDFKKVLLRKLPRLLFAHRVDVRSGRDQLGAPSALALFFEAALLLRFRQVAHHRRHFVVPQLRPLLRHLLFIDSHVVVLAPVAR